MPGRPRSAGPLARLVRSADFERVLRIRQRASTAHFAVHHLHALAESAQAPSPRPVAGELSTIGEDVSANPVDDLSGDGLAEALTRVGAVVPKRHARRAATRSLLKRQIYAAAERHRPQLAPGLWIVRLRSPFDRAQFVSAASLALRRAARAELDALLGAAVNAAAAR